MSGAIRPTTRAEAVARARLMCGDAGARIVYRLKDHSGGRDPFAPDCASHWRTLINLIAVASCDCAGFVAWCLGYDRYQPDAFMPGSGWDWINCDSMIADARGPQTFYEELIATGEPLRDQRPLPGDVVVFPSIDLDHDGSRDRVGHTGIIVAVAPTWTPGDWRSLRVAHCSSGNGRRAIAETSGAPWAGRERFRGLTNPRWTSTILRYRRFAP